MTRVQFVCGGRALRDYRAANQTATSVARRLSVGRDEAPEAVARLLEEHKNSNGVPVHSSNWQPGPKLRNSSSPRLLTPTPRIILRIFDDRDFDDVKLLAHRLVADHGVLALLATRTRDMVRLVCARSADLAVEAQHPAPVCV